MKKVLAVVAAVGCLAAAGTAIAGVAAGTGVNGSLHDMTKFISLKMDAMERVCVYCHTPHHAVVLSSSNDNLPLWNHDITADDQFTAYTWATPANRGTDDAQATYIVADPLAGPSRLCMSCHDGSIAVDEHGPAFGSDGSITGETPAGLIGNLGSTADGVGRANLTKDLSTTHPIGFDYVAIADYRNRRAARGSGTADNASEIVPATKQFATSITESDTAGTYNTVVRESGKFIGDTLYKGRIMTCATCHEVHNKENAIQDGYVGTVTSFPNGLGGTQSAPNYFLYAKQAKSLICLSCHVK